MGDYKDLAENIKKKMPEEFHESIEKMGVFADAYLMITRKTLSVIDEVQEEKQ